MMTFPELPNRLIANLEQGTDANSRVTLRSEMVDDGVSNTMTMLVTFNEWKVASDRAFVVSVADRFMTWLASETPGHQRFIELVREALSWRYESSSALQDPGHADQHPAILTIITIESADPRFTKAVADWIRWFLIFDLNIPRYA